jgi:DNA-binding transcriptional LysR family regulator
MNLADLTAFCTVARSDSLNQASGELHQTPSALSKALRRLEAQLGTPLFERANKQLKLNRSGRLLLPRALQLLQFAEQTRSEIAGTDALVHARIAGPAMLLWGYAGLFAELLTTRFADSSLIQAAKFEDEALAALANGEVDFALVTQAVVATPGKNWQSHWRADLLGSVRMQLCAGPTHPLVVLSAADVSAVSSAELLRHDFVCPQHSLICGVTRAGHSDGWRNHDLPRRIRYWVDDLVLLLALVKSGAALAYLPEFALKTETQLHRIEVSDCPYVCEELVYLVHAPSRALGWQQQMVAAYLQALKSTG